MSALIFLVSLRVDLFFYQNMCNMKLSKASRQQSRIKMAIQGPSGSGKTYSSFLMAKGLVGSWQKVAVVDSENGSSHLYAHLGAYKVLALEAPYSPEKYMDAIGICIDDGAECILLDSISHSWEYLLTWHSSLGGNSFTNWGKITPRQQAFINCILRCNAHVIATMRTKQDYVLQEKNGKHIPEKVGLKAIQRDGVDYDFTVVLDIDIKHNAVPSKDRTGLFMGNPEFTVFKPTVEIGEKIRKWTESSNRSLSGQIAQCTTVDGLKALYRTNKPVSDEYVQQFAVRKSELLKSRISDNGLTTKIQ